MCVCACVCVCGRVSPLSRWDNKKTKTTTTKKTKKQKQKKVRKHHIFRRHTGRVSDTCVQSCFGLSFQKHTVGLFYTVSKMRKHENRNNDIFETVSKKKAFKRRLTRWHRRGRPNDTPSRTPHTKSYPMIYLTSPHYGGTH